MAVELRGKTAVVTGSSKGIGYSVAEALAKANANVVVSARNAAEVEAAARALGGAGEGRVVGVAADVREYDDCRRLIEAAAELGGPDILINNAGVGAFAPVDELTPEKWDQVLETNLSGVFYCCREAVPRMRERGGGFIVNIASLAGKNPFAGGTAYNASKFGLVGFSEALMLDVRQHGIRVNYIMPGSVNTYFNGKEPKPENAWMIQPEDIAEVVMDLLALPSRSLVSRVEIRPSQPPRK